MSWVAIKMLTGNTGKYVGIILGVTFASLLIAQQASIFCGLMSFTISQIKDIGGADIWVMDQNVRFIDDIKPMSENDLYRVRGVPGVAWAVRLYKGINRGRLADGNFQQMILLGFDDATLVGAPRDITLGNLADLRRPEAVFMDENGYQQLWPGEPFTLGKHFEMNDHQATIVGIFKARRTFQTFPVICTRYSQAVRFAPAERKVLSFILADPEPGVSSTEVCRRIRQQTGLGAYTRAEFSEKTIWYFLKNTGIPMNFGITVLLGFVVGTAISGQTFYLFTLENLKQFGALKAMGASNLTLTGMILLQALTVGSIGYGLGVGLAAGFGEITKQHSKLAFLMPWEVLAGAGAAVLLICLLASLLSIRKLIVLEPAIVFQG